MDFNYHGHLRDRHAFLSASKYHWIRYDEEKLANSFITQMAAQRGTELHAHAAEAIRLGIKQRQTKQTFNMYVNDALGYRMSPEVILHYSDNAFGTADTISFHKNLLRIHDLKTGVSKTSFDQLMIYAAFFCLEYGFKPPTIGMELRIYQNDATEVFNPDPDQIVHIMDKIVTFDRKINELRVGVNR